VERCRCDWIANVVTYGAPFQWSNARSTFDIFPNGREFVMIARAEAMSTDRRRLIVRHNWTEQLGQPEATKR